MIKMQEPQVVSATQKYLQQKMDISHISGEFPFVENGCVPDVFGYSNGKIKYIVECKGAVSPGGIAGGIGQALQYAHQKQYYDNISSEAEVYFACPQESKIYLDLMKIPNEINKVLLVQDNNDIIILKKNHSMGYESALHISGTTYLEGITINMLKKIIVVMFNLQRENRTKANFEEQMKKEETELNDFRNVLITPRRLGLIGNNYTLTPKGYSFYGLLERNEKEFEKKIIELLYPTLITTLNALIVYIEQTKQNINNFTFKLSDIENIIIDIYNSKVEFFEARRLSYHIKILKEIGAIEEYINEEMKKVYKIKKITNF